MVCIMHRGSKSFFCPIYIKVALIVGHHCLRYPLGTATALAPRETKLGISERSSYVREIITHFELWIWLKGYSLAGVTTFPRFEGKRASIQVCCGWLTLLGPLFKAQDVHEGALYVREMTETGLIDVVNSG
jgi:hypothetical protein